MTGTRAGGRTAAIAVSVAFHLGVLALLALHAPKLAPPAPEPGGPPVPIIPLLLSPRALPENAEGGRSGAIRLHRRRVRDRDLPAHVRPLVTPAAEAAPAPADTPAASPAAPDEPARKLGEALDLTRVLRSRVGCASPDLLTREEREACDRRLAAGAKDAPYLGAGIERDKARALDASAARKAADVRYRDAPPTPPTAPGRMGSGQTAEGMAAQMGNDRAKLKVPF
ncbi:hypothetical protein [Phenylobacterium sp. J367]|uniref:hypothetical protein n=1 Tax=Phenylobacterium sp. J367 TaxID=2898435 RepID=UPI002151A08D|nr:hypothetical protein [Phenylobacterium sp. J367]MCR5880782.1 hypothetical protein [Phenylobacterium sp. J367]